MEGDIISMQQLFGYEVESVKNGMVQGRHKTNPVSLYCAEKLKRAGLQEAARNIFAKS